MKIVSTFALTLRRSRIRPTPVRRRTCRASSNKVNFWYWLGAGISLACYPFLFCEGVKLYRYYLKAGVIDCDALSPSGVHSYVWGPDRYQRQPRYIRFVLHFLPRREVQGPGHVSPRLSSLHWRAVLNRNTPRT